LRRVDLLADAPPSRRARFRRARVRVEVDVPVGKGSRGERLHMQRQVISGNQRVERDVRSAARAVHGTVRRVVGGVRHIRRRAGGEQPDDDRCVEAPLQARNVQRARAMLRGVDCIPRLMDIRMGRRPWLRRRGRRGRQAAAAPAVVASERRPERVAVVERCERAASGARACIAAAVCVSLEPGRRWRQGRQRGRRRRRGGRAHAAAIAHGARDRRRQHEGARRVAIRCTRANDAAARAGGAALGWCGRGGRRGGAADAVHLDRAVPRAGVDRWGWGH